MAHRFPLLTIATLCALSCASCASSAAPAIDQKTPATIPSAELLGLDLAKTDLQSTLRGRPALVSFWASWCDACAEEFPALNRLNAYANENGAIVVGVAVGDTQATVIEITRKNQLVYTQLIDEEFKLADALGQRHVPTTIVVDRSGHIAFVGGTLDERALAAFRHAIETPPGVGLVFARP